MVDESLSATVRVDTEDLRIALADAQAALADFEEAMERVNDAETGVRVDGARGKDEVAVEFYDALKRQADREAQGFRTTD